MIDLNNPNDSHIVGKLSGVHGYDKGRHGGCNTPSYTEKMLELHQALLKKKLTDDCCSLCDVDKSSEMGKHICPYCTQVLTCNDGAAIPHLLDWSQTYTEFPIWLSQFYKKKVSLKKNKKQKFNLEVSKRLDDSVLVGDTKHGKYYKKLSGEIYFLRGSGVTTEQTNTTVKEARKHSRLTQKQLAHLIGVTPRTVKNWEASNTTANDSVLEACF